MEESSINMKALLEAGVHFGHQTRRWNPKMAKYIFNERNGIYIIDLKKTVRLIQDACDFVKELGSKGGSLLFVGTKRQAQENVRELATQIGAYYVTHRWLGGTLTNFRTIRSRVDRLVELDRMREDGTLSLHTKKEQILLNKERERLDRFLGGIREMTQLPSALFIADIRKERIAVDEARKLGLPVIAIVDTNCDPDLVDHVIPANDDAIRAIRLLTGYVVDAYREGLTLQQEMAEGADEELVAVEGENPEEVAQPVAEVAETATVPPAAADAATA